MGYPWSDGFSLIANDLNPAIDHTTVKLHAFSTWVTVRQNTGNSVRSGATYVILPSLSYVINTVPTTGSWAANFAFSLVNPGTGGQAEVRIYWNGAFWGGLTHTQTADTWKFCDEDVKLLGVGTVQLWGRNTGATGSVYANLLDMRTKPVFLTPY